MGIFFTLFLISAACFVVGLMKPTAFSMLFKSGVSRKKASTIFGLASIVFLVLIGVTAPSAKNKEVASPAAKKTVTSETVELAKTASASVAATSTVPILVTQERIRVIVQGVSNLFAVIYDKDGKMVSDSTENPPYAVTINAGLNDIVDCFDAKDKFFELSKRLYSNPDVGSKISRIKFTAPKQLRASVGSDDVDGINWKGSGPTNFWRAILGYKSFENETGDLNGRTWGVAINPECK